MTVYLYDSAGLPIGMQYHLATDAEDVWQVYWFEKNLLGDIVAVYNESGTKLVSYKYDAWGNFTTTYHNSGASTKAADNPFTYRGYYYDRDLEMYYLGSRYYDSVVKRFINADLEISNIGGSVLEYNLFAYCFNNPVNMNDTTGQWPKWLTGALNVVSGVAQMAAGAALGTFTSWTGVGFVAAGFLMVNGAATVTAGIGQIVNDVTKSDVLTEDNVVRNAVVDVGQSIGGDTGAKIAGATYDVATFAANLYAGKVGLQQAGLAPIKVNINKVLNNPTDEFVTCGPAPGVISEYCRSIPLNGYGKIYATKLSNGFYQLANGHHRVEALRKLGKETIKIFLTK